MSEVISNIKVFPVNNPNAPKVKANVYFDSGLLNVKAAVMEGPTGLFVSLPGRWGKNAEAERTWYNDVKTVNKAATESLNEAILAEYRTAVAATTGTAATGTDDIPF